MKKDFLHGLSHKTAVGLGVVLYLISRFGFGDTSGDILGLTFVAMLQVAGICLFIVGLYRWNRKTRSGREH